jgi:hypothetical protein
VTTLAHDFVTTSSVPSLRDSAKKIARAMGYVAPLNHDGSCRLNGHSADIHLTRAEVLRLDRECDAWLARHPF